MKKILMIFMFGGMSLQIFASTPQEILQAVNANMKSALNGLHHEGNISGVTVTSIDTSKLGALNAGSWDALSWANVKIVSIVNNSQYSYKVFDINNAALTTIPKGATTAVNLPLVSPASTSGVSYTLCPYENSQTSLFGMNSLTTAITSAKNPNKYNGVGGNIEISNGMLSGDYFVSVAQTATFISTLAPRAHVINSPSFFVGTPLNIEITLSNLDNLGSMTFPSISKITLDGLSLSSVVNKEYSNHTNGDNKDISNYVDAFNNNLNSTYLYRTTTIQSNNSVDGNGDALPSLKDTAAYLWQDVLSRVSVASSPVKITFDSSKSSTLSSSSTAQSDNKAQKALDPNRNGLNKDLGIKKHKSKRRIW